MVTWLPPVVGFSNTGELQNRLEDLLKQIAGSHFQKLSSVDLGWGPRNCLSNKFQGDADAVVWGPDVEDRCVGVRPAAARWRRRCIPSFLLHPRPSRWTALHSLAVSVLWIWPSRGAVCCLDLFFICIVKRLAQIPRPAESEFRISMAGAQVLAFDQVPREFWSLLRVRELQD